VESGTVLTFIRRVAHYVVQYAVDVRHGMVTRDVVHGPVDSHAGAEARPHEPSPARQFTRILRSLPIDPSGYIFVDLGSGKGAALILAARHGYRHLVGVELDADLVSVADRNVRALRRRRPDLADRIDLVQQDAAAFEWPHRPTVVYLFNPFGERTLRAVLARLSASLRAAPRSVLVVYVNPVLRRLLDANPAFVPLRTGRGFVVYRSRD